MTCAAVRAGFSRFSATASASTSAGVRGVTRAGAAPAPRTRRPATPRPTGRMCLLRHPHLRAERAVVLARGQLTHQRAALAGRQLRVDHLLDQPVTEQPDLPGPLSPPAGLVIGLGHLLLLRHGRLIIRTEGDGPGPGSPGAARVDQLRRGPAAPAAAAEVTAAASSHGDTASAGRAPAARHRGRRGHDRGHRVRQPATRPARAAADQDPAHTAAR